MNSSNYYAFMLNKKKYDISTIKNNYDKIISKYPSSSYISNQINKLQNNNYFYKLGISLLSGIFYGILSALIDEKITKTLKEKYCK